MRESIPLKKVPVESSKTTYGDFKVLLKNQHPVTICGWEEDNNNYL